MLLIELSQFNNFDGRIDLLVQVVLSRLYFVVFFICGIRNLQQIGEKSDSQIDAVHPRNGLRLGMTCRVDCRSEILLRVMGIGRNRRRQRR